MTGGGFVDREKLEARIAEAEERLRQSIAQRIGRNRSELQRLQHEQELFDQAASPVPGEHRSLPMATGSATALRDVGGYDDDDDNEAAAGPTGASADSLGNRHARTPPTAHGGPADVGLDDGIGDDDEPSKHHCAGHASSAAAVKSEPLLLRMTVDIGDGRTGEVKVRRGDGADELAAAFCKTHGLGERARLLLTEHITSNLADVLSQLRPTAAAAEEAAARPAPPPSVASSSAQASPAGRGAPDGSPPLPAPSHMPTSLKTEHMTAAQLRAELRASDVRAL